MSPAQIGPLTTIFEAIATAVGAGIVLGSVGVGIVRLALGVSRTRVEGNALIDGYVGGAFGAAIALVDIGVRYAL